MRINRNINTTILTNNNCDVLEKLKDEIVVSDLEQLKTIKADFIVFNDVIRTLSQKERERFFNNMETRGIHFINVTSNPEETLYAHELIVFNDGEIILKGSTLSVLKEESTLKHLGYSLPFIVDLSLQLNAYDIIDSIFLDEELLVSKLW